MLTNRSTQRFIGFVFLSALSSCSLLGCGGGDGAGGSATPTRAVVTSTPNNIEEVGGTATYTLDINQATKVDPASVVINVKRGITPFPLNSSFSFYSSDPASAEYQTKLATVIQSKENSLTDGPQVMTPVVGAANRFVYHLTFPASSSPTFGFTAYYTAKDTQGHSIPVAITAGTNENRNINTNGIVSPPNTK